MSQAMREPSKKEEGEAMDAAMKAYISAYKSLPENVRSAYLSCMATLAISILRGMGGPEFTRGFLEDALRSVDEPAQVFIKPLTEH